MSRSKIAIIITAAGSSTRIGGNIKKEYLPYKNGTVLSNCAIAFLKADYRKYDISNFVVTFPAGKISEAEKALFSDTEVKKILNSINLNITFAEGGNSRQASVFNALKTVKDSNTNPDLVLIHDGARPFISEKVINDVVEAAEKFGASVPGVTPIDTQKEIDENGFIKRHLVRKNLMAVQTPQGFIFNKLYEAHVKAIDISKEFTDDTEIWGQFCGNVKTVPGDVNNIKITYPSDLERL